MCTRVMWPDANGAVIVGRNMDFHRDLMTNLWKLPRGAERNDGVKGEPCEGRGLCPSCNARRMAETAAHLVDHVHFRGVRTALA